MKKEKTEEEEVTHRAEEVERWNIVGDAAGRLVVVAGNSVSNFESMRNVGLAQRAR